MAAARKRHRPETQRALVARYGLGKTLWSVFVRLSSLELCPNCKFVPGDVVYLHLFGQGLIFLNSPAAVTELMERRSAIYSDRAPLVMVTELFVLCVDLHALLTMTVCPFFQLWCWTHGTQHGVTIASRPSHSVISLGGLYALW